MDNTLKVAIRSKINLTESAVGDLYPTICRAVADHPGRDIYVRMCTVCGGHGVDRTEETEHPINVFIDPFSNLVVCPICLPIRQHADALYSWVVQCVRFSHQLRSFSETEKYQLQCKIDVVTEEKIKITKPEMN